jgi:hypothetical protein
MKEMMQRATSEMIVRMPEGLQREEGIVGSYPSGFSHHRERRRKKKGRGNE